MKSDSHFFIIRNNMNLNHLGPFTAFRYSRMMNDNHVRGSYIMTPLTEWIKRFPIERLRQYRRYDFQDWLRIVPADEFGMVQGTGLIDDNITEYYFRRNFRSYIPEELWSFIVHFKNFIIEDFVEKFCQVQTLSFQDLNDLIMRIRDYGTYITRNPNTLQSLFGEEDYFDCPFDCQELYKGEFDEITLEMYPPQIKINMLQHLEAEVMRHHQHVTNTDHYNFHFFLATFIANLPNRRGREIRRSENIMRIIGPFVAEEEVFEHVENIWNKIRREMMETLPPDHPIIANEPLGSRMRPIIPEDFGTIAQPIELDD